ncbi:hypothetical protein BD413DRAFT_447284, partial [Trametes elegans]
AVFVNRTIDDEHGDSNSGLPPDFEPQSSWAQGSTCTGCIVQHSRNPPKHDGATIDTSLPFDGTWHDSTYHPGQPERTITVKFTGIAVYVFNIVVNSIPLVTTFTNLTFILDGAHVGNYVHEPDGSSEILYDVPVYTNTTLPHTSHTLVISTGPGLNASLVLFDYIIYT